MLRNVVMEVAQCSDPRELGCRDLNAIEVIHTGNNEQRQHGTPVREIPQNSVGCEGTFVRFTQFRFDGEDEFGNVH